MQRYTVWVQLEDRGYAQKLIRFLNHHYAVSYTHLDVYKRQVQVAMESIHDQFKLYQISQQ